MLHTPTLSKPVPAAAPCPPLPQWPATYGQPYSRITPDNGRTWITVSGAPAQSNEPMTVQSAPEATFSSPVRNHKNAPSHWSIPTPVSSTHPPTRSLRPATPSDSPVKVEHVSDSSSEDERSDESEQSVAASPLSSAKGANVRSPSSQPPATPARRASSPSSPAPRRAISRPQEQAEESQGSPDSEPRRARRNAVRRNGERRRAQNALAQKKHRAKKKKLLAQVSP